jgi:hypothetical protein
MSFTNEGTLTAIWNFVTFKKYNTSIYDNRIDCLKKMIELQKKLKKLDNECQTIPAKDVKVEDNPWLQDEVCKQQYRIEYEKCSKLLMPN